MTGRNLCNCQNCATDNCPAGVDSEKFLEELADAFENAFIRTDWVWEMAQFIRSFQPSGAQVKWPDDLESGFLYAMEVAALSGAESGLLDAMRAEWKINHSPENESECFHCGRLRQHFVWRDDLIERLLAENINLKEQLAELNHDMERQMEIGTSLATECEALRENARGKVYRMCFKHLNSMWPTFSVTYSAPPIEVCPICDADITKQKRLDGELS